MPVSSPSYFPPSRGTDQIVGITAGQLQTGARVFLAGQSAGANSTISDFIAIGNNAASAGLTDAGGTGTVVVGSQCLTGAVTFADGPMLVLGFQTLQTATARWGASVLLGPRILANAIGGGGSSYALNVVIGAFAAENLQPQNGVSFSSNVIIGYRAARGNAVGAGSIIGSILIGHEVCRDTPTGAGGSVSSSVIIGQQAGLLLANSALNVVIGQGAAQSLTTGTANVIIGATTNVQSGGSQNTIIGRASTVTTGSQNVLLGDTIQFISSGSGNIVIGSGAGIATGLNGQNQFVIETNGGATGGMFYGDLANGNLLIGNAFSNAVVKEFGTSASQNVLKLINGHIGTTNPIGGGYFYVAAGNLHWVGSSGTDTLVAPA